MSAEDAIRIRRPPPDFRRATVAAVADRTPHLRTVTLDGPELVGFAPDAPAASARLLVPRAGVLEIPVWNGNEFLFADGSRPPIRTITPLRADPEAGHLDVEVVRHGAGPLSEWVDSAEPGQEVAVSGPGKGYPIDRSARRFLLAGDESALPAIGELLEAIPAAAAVHVVVELSHPDARLDLPEHPGATVEWLDRPAGAPLGDVLLTAVEARRPAADERVWAAGEAAVVHRIRHHLFEVLGLPRGQAVVRGYWKRDRAETA